MLEDIKEKYGFEFAHIGINTESKETALKALKFFEAFGMSTREIPISVFADEKIEIMFSMGPGTNGHIGIRTKDLKGAIRYFENLGFAFDDKNVMYKDNGELKLIYFAEEICGFAVHLVSA